MPAQDWSLADRWLIAGWSLAHGSALCQLFQPAPPAPTWQSQTPAQAFCTNFFP